jgi:hypothetical protein
MMVLPCQFDTGKDMGAFGRDVSERRAARLVAFGFRDITVGAGERRNWS